MKTVMKKLLSLVLVAMLLVSAVPFQAAAVGTDITVYVYSGNVADEDSLEYITTLHAELNSTVDAVKALRSDAVAVYDMDLNALTGAIAGDEVMLLVAAQNAAPVTYTITANLMYQDDSGSAGTSSKTVEAGTYVKFADLAAQKGFTTMGAVVAGNGSFVYTDGVTVDANMSYTIYVPKATTGGATTGGTTGGTTGNVGGENQPSESVTDLSLTIDYKLSGYPIRTVKAAKWSTYDNYVGVPERGGYEFLGWYSYSYDDIIDVTKQQIKEDDTIEAQWSSAKSFTLTLDENRGEEETVNYGVKVTYGENIWAKVSKYNPERKGYVFLGWKLNGNFIDEDTVWDLPDDATAYAIWGQGTGTGTGTVIPEEDGKVWLEIYVNGKTGELEKRVDITSLLKDEKITRDEVKKVVNKYVTAKSGYSLKYEGLFDEESWYWYCRDPETDGVESITIETLKGEIYEDHYIYVMVNNVKTVAADSTNPKTGDMIFASMATMSTAAAAAFVMLANKKRLVK